MYLSFQFQMSKKEREICEFEMDLKNLFVCALIDCEQSLVFFAKLLHAKPKHASGEAVSCEKRE